MDQKNNSTKILVPLKYWLKIRHYPHKQDTHIIIKCLLNLSFSKKAGLSKVSTKRKIDNTHYIRFMNNYYILTFTSIHI